MVQPLTRPVRREPTSASPLRAGTLLVAICLYGLLAGTAHARRWNLPDKKTVTAAYRDVEGTLVVVSADGGRRLLPFHRLDPDDQQYVRERLTAARATARLARLSAPERFGRDWFDHTPQTVYGRYVGISPDSDIVRLEVRSEVKRVRYAALSPADQKYVRQSAGEDGQLAALQTALGQPARPAAQPGQQIAQDRAPARGVRMVGQRAPMPQRNPISVQAQGGAPLDGLDEVLGVEPVDRARQGLGQGNAGSQFAGPGRFGGMSMDGPGPQRPNGAPAAMTPRSPAASPATPNRQLTAPRNAGSPTATAGGSLAESPAMSAPVTTRVEPPAKLDEGIELGREVPVILVKPGDPGYDELKRKLDPPPIFGDPGRPIFGDADREARPERGSTVTQPANARHNAAETASVPQPDNSPGMVRADLIKGIALGAAGILLFLSGLALGCRMARSA